MQHKQMHYITIKDCTTNSLNLYIKSKVHPNSGIDEKLQICNANLVALSAVYTNVSALTSTATPLHYVQRSRPLGQLDYIKNTAMLYVYKVMH